MIDAAQVYCLSSLPTNPLTPSDYEDEFHSSVRDGDSRAYWESAATVLNDILERDGEITSAQLFYVARVYPERVTAEEAVEAFENRRPDQGDRHAWETAAFDLGQGSRPVIGSQPRL